MKLSDFVQCLHVKSKKKFPFFSAYLMVDMLHNTLTFLYHDDWSVFERNGIKLSSFKPALDSYPTLFAPFFTLTVIFHFSKS